MKVLFFKPGDICHNSLGLWTDLLAGLFVDMGIETVSVDISAESDRLLADVGEVLSKEQIDVAMAFNANAAYILFRELFDKYGITFYNYIVDHPLDHHRALDNAFGDYHVICIDQMHADFIRRYFKKVNGVHFLPLAGMGKATMESPDEFSRRKYDITFTGNLFNTSEMVEAMAKMPEGKRNMYMAWIRHMLLYPHLAPEEALREVFKENNGGIETTDEGFISAAIEYKEAVFFVRNFIREEVISILLDADIDVHVFGSGWDQVIAAHPEKKGLFHGDISLDKTMDVNYESKIVLNILPWFKAGTHDRIETAQLCGAAVLTDDNGYLRDLYTANEIFFYSSADTRKLPDIVKDMLSDPVRLHAVATNGMKFAGKTMTWEVHAGKLAEIFRGKGQ